MFSCFKSLNKKFICSICSACLLCMTGVSQLRAEGNPLTLGNTNVGSATVGTNAFLTNTLQDHIYSSRLLPIFSKKPFLYVDAEGNPKLSIDEIPDQNRIPFGAGTSTSVLIAAMPVDDTSSDESDESLYDNLTWHLLTDRSWNKLCVRDIGPVKIIYNVVSTDKNIKGTMDESDLTTLDLRYSPVKRNILSDSYFNENAKILGFEYCIPISDGDLLVEKIATISMDPNDKGDAEFTFDEFLDNLWKTNFFLMSDVHQYDTDANNLNETLEIHPTIYSFCVMMILFALHTNNDDMLKHVAEKMRTHAISYENQNGDIENGDKSLPPLIPKSIKSAADARKVFAAATGVRAYGSVDY